MNPSFPANFMLLKTFVAMHIHSALTDMQDINYFFLSLSVSRVVKISEKERIAPINDISQILGLFIVIKDSTVLHKLEIRKRMFHKDEKL